MTRDEPNGTLAAGAPAVGVNVAGFFGSALGIGEAARQVRAALEVAAMPVASRELRPAHGSMLPVGDLRQPDHGSGGFPLNLVCANADTMPAVRDQLGPEFFTGRHTVGLWWWEVDAFPERWIRSFDDVDEVWVGSRFTADALAAVSPVPVVRMAMPVAAPAVAPEGAGDLGLPPGFRFLLMFDHGSVLARKNPLGAVEAFRRAFPEDGADGPVLVVKVMGVDRHADDHARLVEAVAGHPRIRILDRVLSTREKNALIAECDCYVSLHRSEGFGLPLAEALLLERPVIATAYSGPLEFLTPENAFLVGFEPARVGPGNDPYPPEATWAEPDLEQAARLMREVFGDPVAARTRAARGRRDVERAHSPAVAGRAMAERLARIAGASPSGEGGGSLDTTELERRIWDSPLAAPAAGGGRLRALLRSLLVRAVRPQTVHQRHVDEEVLRVLRTLDDRTRAVAAAQAALLAELRRSDEEVGRGGEPRAELPPPDSGGPLPPSSR